MVTVQNIKKLHDKFVPVTAAWCILSLQIVEERASRYWGELQIYWIHSQWQSTMGGPPGFVLGEELKTHHKT